MKQMEVSEVENIVFEIKSFNVCTYIYIVFKFIKTTSNLQKSYKCPFFWIIRE